MSFVDLWPTTGIKKQISLGSVNWLNLIFDIYVERIALSVYMLDSWRQGIIVIDVPSVLFLRPAKRASRLRTTERQGIGTLLPSAKVVSRL